MDPSLLDKGPQCNPEEHWCRTAQPGSSEGTALVPGLWPWQGDSPCSPQELCLAQQPVLPVRNQPGFTAVMQELAGKSFMEPESQGSCKSCRQSEPLKDGSSDSSVPQNTDLKPTLLQPEPVQPRDGTGSSFSPEFAFSLPWLPTVWALLASF